MSNHEVSEHIEHAHHQGERGIGLTTAIWAVLLAVATLLSHRAHTDALLEQARMTDEWAFYQAKHARAYLFAALAEMETRMPNASDIAKRNLKKSIEEECGAPVEKGCTTPIKDSPDLNALLAAMKTETAEGGEATHASASPASAQSNASTHPDNVNKKDDSGSSEKQEPHKTVKPKDGATKVQEKAEEMEKRTEVAEKKANYYDGGELFLEISIVLCSISLLSESKTYWKLSFISTAIGVAVVLWGLLLH
jgi:uncharacterized protein DUF4337